MKKEEISKRIEEIESELKELRTKLTEEDKDFRKLIYLIKFGASELFSHDESKKAGFEVHSPIQISNCFLEDKCFFLSVSCEWELKEYKGVKFLIPTKK